MLATTGYVLIGFGLVLILLAVLAWVGVLKIQAPPKEAERALDWSEVIKAALEKVPWVALFGIILIYLGLRTVGVDLSF
jgi:hypothetical protein